MWLWGGQGQSDLKEKAGSDSTLTRIPDFERLVVRTGDDRLSVGREGDGIDPIAVGVRLLALQSQGGRIYRQGGTRQLTFKAGS